MTFNKNKTKIFLTLRVKENGGFGANPFLPATLEDTYFGTLASFFLSDGFFKKIKPKILKFLDQLNFQEIHEPIKGYQILKMYQLLNLDLPLEFKRKVKELINSHNQFKDYLHSRVFALWHLSMISGDKKIAKNIKNHVNYMKFKTLEELYYLSEISPSTKGEYINLVLKSQNGDGGFGFYPGTTSYLENTYYALKILSNLIIYESVLIKAKEFILACYNSDGGFARKPGGISYLSTTAMALESLAFLSKSM